MTIQELLEKDYTYFERLSTDDLYKLNRRLQQYIINRNRTLGNWEVNTITSISSAKVKDVTQAHNVYFSRVWRALKDIRNASSISELREERNKYRKRFDEEGLSWRNGDDMRRAYNYFVHDRQARRMLTSDRVYEAVHVYMTNMAPDVVKYNYDYDAIVGRLYTALFDGELEQIRDRLINEEWVRI